MKVRELLKQFEEINPEATVTIHCEEYDICITPTEVKYDWTGDENGNVIADETAVVIMTEDGG